MFQRSSVRIVFAFHISLCVERLKSRLIGNVIVILKTVCNVSTKKEGKNERKQAVWGLLGVVDNCTAAPVKMITLTEQTDSIKH